MARRHEMVKVRFGKGTFKVRSNRLDDFLKTHPGAEVVGASVTAEQEDKAVRKPAAKKAS